MKRKNYPAIDIAKFIMAILVVAIHVRPFGGTVGFLFDDCIARIADPLFFAITSFFMFQKAFGEQLSWKCLGTYMKRIGLLYGCWVLLHSYVILKRALYLTGGGWDMIRYLLQQIFLSGPYGALWFLTALLLAIPLTFALTKWIGPNLTLLVSCPFYLYLVLELGYTHLVEDVTLLNQTADLVGKIFFWQWNGLTFGFFFCALGMWIAWRRQGAASQQMPDGIKPKKSTCWGLVMSLVGLVAEAVCMKRLELGTDFAAMFFMIPLTAFLLEWLLDLPLRQKKSYVILRNASVLIFTMHFGIMELLQQLLKQVDWYMENTTIQYVTVLAVTLLLSGVILYLSKHCKAFHWMKILY